MLKQNIGIIVNIAVVNAAPRLNKVIEQKKKVEHERKMKSKIKFMLKQNIGMSVDIAVVDMNKI